VPVWIVDKIIFLWMQPLSAATARTEEAALSEDAEKTAEKRTTDFG
jgi:hypothetical protein